MSAIQLQAIRAINRISTYVRHHGVGSTLFYLAYLLTNKIVAIQIFKIFVLLASETDWSMSTALESNWTFLSYDALKQFHNLDPLLDLDDAFLLAAAARGDQCYGLVENGNLVSYSWYSNNPTPINSEALADFDRQYLYMYKAYTLPAFRGRRLYTTGVFHAARVLLQDGIYKGIVTLVQIHNKPSLKALLRINFTNVGVIVVLGLRRRSRFYVNSSCESLIRAELRS
jgi:hypothetical protein